jgi:hypothetical protein
MKVCIILYWDREMYKNFYVQISREFLAGGTKKNFDAKSVDRGNLCKETVRAWPSPHRHPLLIKRVCSGQAEGPAYLRAFAKRTTLPPARHCAPHYVYVPVCICVDVSKPRLLKTSFTAHHAVPPFP